MQQEGVNAMERSSPSELLKAILQSTLFLVEHYGNYIEHRDTGPALHELRTSLIRAIGALDGATTHKLTQPARTDSSDERAIGNEIRTRRFGN